MECMSTIVNNTYHIIRYTIVRIGFVYRKYLVLFCNPSMLRQVSTLATLLFVAIAKSMLIIHSTMNKEVWREQHSFASTSPSRAREREALDRWRKVGSNNKTK